MYLKKGRPRIGEVVICKPKKVMAHSATLELVEYDGVEAFIHISQVSYRWVKSISKFIKPGSEIICRVIRTGDRVEVSLKEVSKEARNSKLAEGRNEKRAVNIVKAAAKKTGKSEAVLEKELVTPVMKEYGSIHAFIELLKQEGDTILEELKIPFYWKKPVLDYSSETVKNVHLRKEIELHTTEPDGVERIRKSLLAVVKPGVEIRYISAPKYLLRITSRDYK
jgi:translation initiation factor 2 subunit 1